MNNILLFVGVIQNYTYYYGDLAAVREYNVFLSYYESNEDINFGPFSSETCIKCLASAI